MHLRRSSCLPHPRGRTNTRHLFTPRRHCSPRDVTITPTIRRRPATRHNVAQWYKVQYFKRTKVDLFYVIKFKFNITLHGAELGQSKNIINHNRN